MTPRPSLISIAARQLARAQQPKRALSSAARPLTRPHFVASARPASLAPTLPSPARAFSSSPACLAAPPARAEYKKLGVEDVKAFASFLSSPSSLVTTIPAPNGEWQHVEKDDLEGYNKDWMDKYTGDSSLLLKPKTTEEVSKIMAYCFDQRIAVVPQGGNTGLVGGGVPVYDEVILSTEAMKEVRHFDDVSGILTCDGGAILESLSNYLHPLGYMMPLDLGAKGSCHIAGNVATNAGGLRLLRYGSLHGTVLGIEAVLPDSKGTVISVNMPGSDKAGALRKDNTGYDLKQLFIGSEGTLGIITGVSIMTPRLPTAINVAVLAVPSFANVQRVFKETRIALGEILSAFEFWDHEGMGLVLEHTGQKAPFDQPVEGDKPFYVLIETSGSNKDHDDEKLGALLEKLLEEEIIADGVLAQDETQLQSLWSLRESLPEAAGKLGKTYKYDLSMPVSKMYSLVEETRERIAAEGLDKSGKVKLTIGYGHIGDGNVHLNVIADKWDDAVGNALEPWVYEATQARNGSISAEHGLGVMKAPYVGYSKSDESVELMQAIRKLFDPRQILSPYKYLPPAPKEE